MNKSRDINEQKRLYKNSKKSLCHKCYNINNDCFDVTKYCGTDGGLSYVHKCGSINKPIDVTYKENKVTVQALSDSRIDTMGGGFQNVDKYKDEVKET